MTPKAQVERYSSGMFGLNRPTGVPRSSAGVESTMEGNPFPLSQDYRQSDQIQNLYSQGTTPKSSGQKVVIKKK